MLLKRPRCQNVGDKSGLFVTIHFFSVNSVTYLMIDITLPLNKVLNFQQSNLRL